MDLGATLLSTGWASGVNAYGTVAMLGLLGRAGIGEVPDSLESYPVIAVASVMFLIEFVTDKVPFLDNAWDSVHTFIRPAIGGWIGSAFGTEADLSAFEEVGATGGTGLMALASHAVKASLRVGINMSPEPASNIIVSLGEDATVAGIVALAMEAPEVTAAIAIVLLLGGVLLVILLAKRIRAGWRKYQAWRARRQPPQSSNSA